MPQLDKFAYFSQFFWLCLFFFTFYIFICNDGDGVLQKFVIRKKETLWLYIWIIFAFTNPKMRTIFLLLLVLVHFLTTKTPCAWCMDGDHPVSPVPSISSDSWIYKHDWGDAQQGDSSHPTLSGVITGEPPEPGPGPAGGGEAGEPVPSILEIKSELKDFTSSFNRIKIRSDFLIGLFDRLEILESSPLRLKKIKEGMDLISALQGQEKPISGKKAGDALVDFIQKWDKHQN